MRIGKAISTALVLAAFGCGGGGGGGTPSCPNALDITGVWTGSATNDSLARGSDGTINTTITQTNCALGGTWSFVFSDPELDEDLIIGGSPPTSTDVFFQIGDIITSCDSAGNCATASCVWDVRATLVEPNEMVGTYAANVSGHQQTCSQSRSGDFDIRRTAVLTQPTPVPTAVLPTPTPAP
jgi:hypothetical protein